MSNFQLLRQQCQEQGTLYEDFEFPPGNRAIYSDYKSDVADIIFWKRPKEFYPKPEFISKGISRFDLSQGEWGDCWFIAAAGALTTKPDLFYRVVPNDQDFGDNYAGIFHFNFWRFGEWKEVIIDDRLPVRDGRLVFGRNRDHPGEMWGALLEKAYAKLHGCYAGLWAGFVRDALVDFTGGLSESYNLKKRHKLPDNLFKMMLNSFSDSAMLGCGLYPDQGATSETLLENGLYTGHAYTITHVKQLSIHGIKRSMLRLRNPWGQGEWNGAWSDGSREWNLLSESERDDLGLVFEEDGEFWMEFSDWLDNFHIVDIVHLSPNTFGAAAAEIETNTRMQWKESVHHGAWIRGVNAGGSGMLGETKLFYKNPQYHMTLEEADDDDNDGLCECIISLMQKYKRPPPGVAKPRMLLIGYDVIRVTEGTPIPLDGEHYDSKVLTVKKFRTSTNQREISCRLKLEPAVYCVIPNTLKSNEESDFLLRIYTRKNINSSFIDKPTRPVTPSRPVPTTDIDEEPDTAGGEIPLGVFFDYTGNDYVIDAYDLQALLNDTFKIKMEEDVGFSKETCRCLLAVHDSNRTGGLTYEEIGSLWVRLKWWKDVFKKYDVNLSGHIETFELRKLFHDIGYSLSFNTVADIAVRYGGKKASICFDDFVLCATRATAMYASFLRYSKETVDGQAHLTLEEWMHTTMYF